MAQAWEYKILRVATEPSGELIAHDAAVRSRDHVARKSLVNWLAELGSDGFEVVGVAPMITTILKITGPELSTLLIYTLKREALGDHPVTRPL
jgi:hypothetical protein